MRDLNRVLGSGHDRRDESRASSADIRAECQGQHLLQRDDIERDKRRQSRRGDRAGLYRDCHQHSIDDREHRVHAQDLLCNSDEGGRLPVLVSPSARGEDKVVQNADDPVQGEAEEEQGDRENDEGPGHVSQIFCEATTHDFLLFHVLLGPVRLRDAEMIPERLIHVNSKR